MIHVRYRAHVPGVQILIEIVASSECSIHVLHARNVPIGQIRVERLLIPPTLIRKRIRQKHVNFSDLRHVPIRHRSVPARRSVNGAQAIDRCFREAIIDGIDEGQIRQRRYRAREEEEEVPRGGYKAEQHESQEPNHLCTGLGAQSDRWPACNDRERKSVLLIVQKGICQKRSKGQNKKEGLFEKRYFGKNFV